MKFLDGYKTLLGLTGVVLYAAARVLTEVPACTAAFEGHLAQHGLDLSGGMAVGLTVIGLIHRQEKRKA